ncbi:ABC transporter ATP-binding protein [Demequina mangrovi]|uniref:ABC-2 type transport system ATP-binding protein n=1 Tax=Demequina mangrovi TaxID=1043493 RepID=A0A1H7ADF7_9MICO|nr:ABC transporter ATP-binding protein [Demequina mangrovi]SEJ63683.1 ABC-2 type transport system ATP-binding protein [Demequina mangrovi]
MAAWGAHGLTVERGGRAALANVTLTVAPGEIVAVVGGDGAGKTTLLRTLAGAIAPTAGEVATPALERIGFMPTAAGVWRDLSVDENIAFVAAAHGIAGATLEERRAALLAGAGLEHATERLARNLSGGMRQKLAFSLAMLHRPDLLILDEPSTGVDPVSRVDLWRMVSLAASQGAAVVMATTYLDEAERAHRVTVLDAGEVLLEGAPADVLAGIPGHVVAADAPGDPARTWRRGRGYRIWSPEEPPEGEPRVADIEDAVVAAAIAKGA